MGKRLCGQRTVSVGGRDAEDKGANLPPSFARSVAMDARKGREIVGGCGVRPALYDAYQHSAQTVGESCGDRQEVFVSHRAPYICYDDADAWCGFIYDLEVARTYGCENDAGLCQNHQPKEGRGGKSRERIVRLIRNRVRFRKRFTLLWGV